ncbi:MAG: LysM peptidoglycan-binding domain-containing protein [Sporichthyaceae bacterium]
MSTGTVVNRSSRLSHPAGRALRPGPGSPVAPRLHLVPPPAERAELPVRLVPVSSSDALLSALPAAVAGPVLRLTPRGRGVAVLVLLAAIFGLGMAFGSSAIGADEAPAPVEHASVVVQPGETLWGIARSADPGRDPRNVVGEIRRLNALPSAEIQAGQVLLLP